MKTELSITDLDRIDVVDNAVFNVIEQLNPSSKPVEWDMEIIGEVADLIGDWLVAKGHCTEQEFKPSITVNDNIFEDK